MARSGAMSTSQRRFRRAPDGRILAPTRTGCAVFRTSWADFVAATRDNRPPLSDGELGRDCVEVIYAAYLAAERGARVSLPFDGD